MENRVEERELKVDEAVQMVLRMMAKDCGFTPAERRLFYLRVANAVYEIEWMGAKDTAMREWLEL